MVLLFAGIDYSWFTYGLVQFRLVFETEECVDNVLRSGGVFGGTCNYGPCDNLSGILDQGFDAMIKSVSRFFLFGLMENAGGGPS